jgi:hypothetical protein
LKTLENALYTERPLTQRERKRKKRKINSEKKDEQRKKEKESVHQHWTSARKRLERRGEREVSSEGEMN